VDRAISDIAMGRNTVGCLIVGLFIVGC